MKVPKELNRLRRSFKVAIAGIVQTFKDEKNMQIHGWLSVFVTLLSLWARIDWWQYLLIIAMILLVLAFELFNTALETAFNLQSMEPHPLIKKGKDASAGAVLLICILAVIVGITILFPPLMTQTQVLHHLLTQVYVPSAIQLASMICVWFVLLIVIIQWNRIYRYSLIVSFFVWSSMFAIFTWSSTPWLQAAVLLLPYLYAIFARRGFQTLFTLSQIVVSNFGVYLLYYLLK